MNKKIKLNIKTATVATVAVHVTNRIMNHISTSRNILSDQQGHNFPWKEGNIFYTKSGQGEQKGLIRIFFCARTALSDIAVIQFFYAYGAIRYRRYPVLLRVRRAEIFFESREYPGCRCG